MHLTREPDASDLTTNSRAYFCDNSACGLPPVFRPLLGPSWMGRGDCVRVTRLCE